MEAKELRIGNLIYRNGKVSEIKYYDFEHFEKKDDPRHYIEWRTIKPIPLTEEWLLKFGLEQMKDSTTYEWKDGDYRSVQVDLKPDAAEIYLCGYDSVMASQCFPVDHIKYVHEFQNLFFALKGKELYLDKNKHE